MAELSGGRSSGSRACSIRRFGWSRGSCRTRRREYTASCCGCMAPRTAQLRDPSPIIRPRGKSGICVHRGGQLSPSLIPTSLLGAPRISGAFQNRVKTGTPRPRRRGSSDGPTRGVAPSPAGRIRSASGTPRRSVPPAGGPRHSPETTTPRWRVQPGASPPFRPAAGDYLERRTGLGPFVSEVGRPGQVGRFPARFTAR
jgi:hypothetical protein